MSSDQSNPAKQLASLLTQLGRHYEPEPAAERDPVTQLVLGFLEYEATREQAEEALGRILEPMVDANDLRVSLLEEVVDLLGRDYPLAEQRVARMLQSLHEVYQREHSMQMRGAEKAGKKDQRFYLDTLPGMVPYVAAKVMLVSFGAHAMPVDRRMVALLAGEQIVTAGAEPGQVEPWMLRQVKAERGMKAHLLLQAWADDNAVASEKLDAGEAVKASRPAALKQKKKVAKKKAAKKKSVKKAAASKKAVTKKGSKKKSSKAGKQTKKR